MSINCDKLQDQYSDYFEDTLAPADVTEFEGHLATCDACRSDYHVFATMFQFLDRVEVAEVEAPSGLRASILAEISQRPAQRTFVLKDWLAGVFAHPQIMWGTGLVTAAVIVVALVVAIHPLQKSTQTNTVSAGLEPSAGSGISNTPLPPLVQSVVLKEGAQNLDYEFFTLHTPPSVTSTANVSAYVLQDGDPIADATMESDTDKASPAWSGSIEPDESVSLPVSVTSDVAPGMSLNLLLDWTAQDGSFQGGREVAFVPISAAPASATPVPSGSTFYDAVRTIAGEYQQTVVADTSALNALRKVPALSGTTGNELNADQALESVLAPDGFTVTVQPGGYYLISHP
jgi:hypothetical protein